MPALVRLMQYARAHRLGFAAWKAPGEAYKAIAGKVQPADLDITSLSPGFLVQPFQGQAQLIELEYSTDDLPEKWISPEPLSWYEGPYPQQFLTETGFCAEVEKAVETIRSGAMQKIVLARHQEVLLHEGFDLFDLFFRLQETYPDAFTALVSLPGYGTWIGASPETLVNITARHIETVALAGTITPGQDFTAKENDEQELVSVFIREQFAAAGLTVQEDRNLTQRSGHLQHLVTRFSADLNNPADHQKASQLVSRLHPTPAVAGLPQAKSIQYILEHEGPERALYSGCWGPIHIDQPARLMVNLRCMQVWPGKAVLYAGCGITRDSVAIKEWQETREKMQVMGRMI